MAREHILHEPNNPEAWICICGNRPDSDGFFPCDAQGNEVEPTAEAWTTNAYVCQRCGRVVDQGTLVVLGQNRSSPIQPQ